MGIDYAFFWNMPEEKRNAFIETYHLKNLSDDLFVELRAKPEKDQQIEFFMILQNNSDQPLRVRVPSSYQGDFLLLRSADGNFIRKIHHVEYKRKIFDKESFHEILPNETKQFHFMAKPRWFDATGWSNQGLNQPREFVLDFGDMLHVIKNPGKLEAYATLYFSKPNEAQEKSLGISNIWYGRIVSKPIEIDVKPME
jgi:hypothetical protein